MPIPSSEHSVRRLTVVTNATAGALVAAPDAETDNLPDLFAKAGLEAQFVPNDAGSLPERIEAAVAADVDAIVVAGGDGTVACAAQRLRGHDGVTLGILPFGTMNLLAKDLHLPIEDTAQAVAVIARGQRRRIDVAEVNGHVFLCAAMLGLPTTIGRHREGVRGERLKFLRRMPLALWRSVFRAAPLRGELTIGEDTVRVKASALTITVNAVDDSTGARFARQRLEGGELVCYLVPPGGLLAWAGFVLRVLAGRWRRAPGVREWRGRRMVLDRFGRHALHVMLDGEMRLLEPPLVFTCHPGALTVSVP
jgi:diacylglycerol kinase family enzyme